jgi:hypothetical protein
MVVTILVVGGSVAFGFVEGDMRLGFVVGNVVL